MSATASAASSKRVTDEVQRSTRYAASPNTCKQRPASDLLNGSTPSKPSPVSPLQQSKRTNIASPRIIGILPPAAAYNPEKYSYLKRRPDLPVAAHAEFATSAISEVVAEAAVAAADAAVAAADAALAAAAVPTKQQQVQGEQSVEELLLNLKHADCATAAAAAGNSARNSSVDRAVKQQQPKRKRSKAPTANAPELPVATNWLGWSMSVSTKRQRAKYG
eukprot:2123-Heterococcus_DN1.PRE.1